MDIQELDKAKLKSAEDLSAIQLAVAEGRAVLNSLEHTIEQHLVHRDELGYQRVRDALADSKDALAEISKNHDELRDYAAAIRNCFHTLLLFRDQIVAFSTDAKDALGKEDEKLTAKLAEIQTVTTDLRVLHTSITEDRKQLARELANVNEETRALKDKRAALERAWNELTIKQSTT